MNYAMVDANGVLIAFMDDTINTIPAGAIALTAAQYQQWTVEQSTLVWSNGNLVAAPTVTLTPAQLLTNAALAALNGGCQITSTGTPTLSGTYAVDSGSQSHMQAELLALIVTGNFADGTSSVGWPDTSGVVHVFPSQASFQAFALAIGAFVAGCYKVLNGTGTAVPAQTVTIP